VSQYRPEVINGGLYGLGIGCSLGSLLIGLDQVLKGFSLRAFSAATFGPCIGTIVAWLLDRTELFIFADEKTRWLIRLGLFLAFGYLGMILAMRSNKEDFALLIPYIRFRSQNKPDNINVLDTSVIIDGRIADVDGRALTVEDAVDPQRVRIDANELIRDTVLLLQPVFKQRSVAVTSQLSEFLPVIYGDANSIQRLLINLLDNAVDACDAGGSVKIGTLEQSGLNHREQGVSIEVADTGGGIQPEMLTKVFDLFVTTKAPGKGTGLGLVICQEIVKAHGGTINITSQVGNGTTVTVFLPVNAIAAADLAVGDRDERAYTDC
jgi:hypothetical protein